MRKRGFKGKVVKKRALKAATVCRCYDDLQLAALDAFEADDDIVEIQMNIGLDDAELKLYMTDFLCKRTNGSYFVRECAFRKVLLRPQTVKLLDGSRNYWQRKGIRDWGIIVEIVIHDDEE